MTKLIADLLALQDPEKPHTLLTRVVVSLIILSTGVVFAGFFGVLGAVVVYLFGVELMGIDQQWMFAPVGIALIVGLKNSLGCLTDYWRHYGHG